MFLFSHYTCSNIFDPFWNTYLIQKLHFNLGKFSKAVKKAVKWCFKMFPRKWGCYSLSLTSFSSLPLLTSSLTPFLHTSSLFSLLHTKFPYCSSWPSLSRSGVVTLPPDAWKLRVRTEEVDRGDSIQNGGEDDEDDEDEGVVQVTGCTGADTQGTSPRVDRLLNLLWSNRVLCGCLACRSLQGLVCQPFPQGRFASTWVTEGGESTKISQLVGGI